MLLKEINQIKSTARNQMVSLSLFDLPFMHLHRIIGLDDQYMEALEDSDSYVHSMHRKRDMHYEEDVAPKKTKY